LPNIVIEAQATGLPCIISNTITKEVKIVKQVKFMSLNSSACEWADFALKFQGSCKRNSVKEDIINSGYDINSALKKIECVFFNGENKQL
jgi:hypothetical protein